MMKWNYYRISKNPWDHVPITQLHSVKESLELLDMTTFFGKYDENVALYQYCRGYIYEIGVMLFKNYNL